MKTKKLSKFLSLILRHRPEVIGIELTAQGWASIEELLDKMAENGQHYTLKDIQEVVANNDKKRFKISEDGKYIRANQGHSIEVDLGLTPQIPPEVLYHGTAQKNLNSIFQNGLQKRKRAHVHLSKDIATAIKVGSRHGKPVVLKIRSKLMQEEGFLFYLSENGVWLTEQIPITYFEIIPND